jgi:hypothetical protein
MLYSYAKTSYKITLLVCKYYVQCMINNCTLLENSFENPTEILLVMRISIMKIKYLTQ